MASIRNPIVGEFETAQIIPKSTLGNEHTLPTEYFGVKCSFVLSGVTNATANAIRRVISTELITKAMFIDVEDITTNDEFVIPEMVAARIRMIPLDQKCPAGAQFSLYATNNKTRPRFVYASELSIIGQHKMKSLPFSSRQIIMGLNPGKSVKMNPISIRMESASTDGSGMHAVACHCASVALDVEIHDDYVEIPGKPNEFRTIGVSSTIADPRKWKISFITNGTIDPAECIKQACDNIIARLNTVNESLDQITAAVDENTVESAIVIGGASKQTSVSKHSTDIANAYALVIGGETDTIGNLFMKHAIVLFPEIHAATYHIDEYDKTCTLKIRTIDDPRDVFDEILSTSADIFRSIKSQF